MTMKSRRRSAVAAAAAVAIAGLVSPVTALAGPTSPATTSPSPTAAGDTLILSEYVEGSSFNKALELYNYGTATIDLAAYEIVGSQNGGTSTYTVALTGSLAPGAVHVVAHGDWALEFMPDQTANLQFNGDDAVVLRTTADEVVDSIGQIGVDPGTAWGVAPTTTANATLVRKPDVCTGDTVADDAFDPAVQWTGLPQNDISDLGSHTVNCVPAGPVEPVINEFSASTDGTDLEFHEVYGEPATDYSGLNVLQVEGDGASSALGQVVTAHAVGTTDSAGFWHADVAANTIQNGTLTLLLVSGYTDQMVLDADRDGVLDEGTGLTVMDSVAIHDGGDGDLTYSSTVLGVSYDGADFAPGGASRVPDGTDTDSTAEWVRNAFNRAGLEDGLTPAPGEAWNTPGAPNEVYEEEPPPPGGECGDPATAVGAVQGEGSATPIPGPVTVEGVVVGDFQSGGFNGFYLQDDGDANPATSDGIFVYAPGAVDVEVGDPLRVTGTAGEYEGMTQISGSPTILECAETAELPQPAVLEFPLTDGDQEAVEGMYVTFPADLPILEYFEFGRFGQVVVGTGQGTARQYQPTALAEPGSAQALAIRDHNATHRITIDDGVSRQNPPVLRHPAGGQFTLGHTFRGGDTITDLTGVLDYRFDGYNVQPTEDAVFTEVNTRPAAPPSVGESTMTVAAFNVLNYFTTLGSRGAQTPEELERQETKIVAALAELDADVVGLIEIENNDDVAVGALTDALNAELGAGTYDFVSTGPVGTDEITTAFIFKRASVTPVGEFATLTEEVDPRFLDSKNRPTLAQTFEEVATGELVTVAVNHLKSKGSSCEDVGDPEDPWAANCNVTRTRAAEAMVDWLASDPTGSGSDNTLVIGDLNSYDKEDPIDVFGDAGYSDLLLDYQGEEEYSYVFDGQLGYLDYALANGALSSKVTGTAAWKINADEPSVLDYTMGFKPDEQDALFEPNAYRSSDHDPVLVGLDLADGEPADTTPPELAVTVDPPRVWPPNNQWRDVETTVVATDDSADPVTVTLVGATAEGPAGADIEVITDTEFRVRAVRAAVYTIIYEATDSSGNSTTASVTVEVPRDQGRRPGKGPR